MSKRVFILALSFVLVVALCLAGCTPARRPYNNDITRNRTTYTDMGTNRGYDTGNYAGNYPGNYTGAGANPGTTNYSPGNNTGTAGYGTGTNMGMGTNAGNTTSDRIEAAVRQIQGVQNATAVVNGNTVYVGITLAGTAANKANIERKATEIVREIETGAKTVYVSTDTNFMNQLRNMNQGVRSGNPTNGFDNDLRNLVNGMTPAK